MSNLDLHALSYNFLSWAEQNLSTGSIQYNRVFYSFFDIAETNQLIGNIDELFSIRNIKDLNNERKSYVRPALKKIRDYMFENGYIENYKKYELEELIDELCPSEVKGEAPPNFYSANELRYIFSDQVTYRTSEEEHLVPVICSLSFFYLFKQVDIIHLELTDYDVDKGLIRNRRGKDQKKDTYSSQVVDWISLNEMTNKYLRNYMSYRKQQQNSNANYLLITDLGKQLTNQKINNMFEASSLKKSVNNTTLIQTMIFEVLKKTEGAGLYSYILKLINNTDSKQFKNGFNYFMKNFEEQQEKVYELEDILPPLKSPRTENKEGLYNEENDLTKDDLVMYEENPDMNLKANKISIQRLVRNSLNAQRLKEAYNNKCQLCDLIIKKADGSSYSEAHHIKPYNKIHRGDDNIRNMIILCPNCHTQFDDLYFAINPDSKLIHCIRGDEDPSHLAELHFISEHQLDKQYLDYTWGLFEEKKSGIESSQHNLI